jgi:hypothetical protein
MELKKATRMDGLCIENESRLFLLFQFQCFGWLIANR